MKRSSLRELAYESIRAWIQSQVLQKGSVTSEIQLSRKLDMSRTPVRAALQQLELEGYLRIIPKHGVLILESSAQRVGDLLDLIFSTMLFTIEFTRQFNPQSLRVLNPYIEEFTYTLSGRIEQNVPKPEVLGRMELQLFRQLVSLSRNIELERLFEQSVERLYWLENVRRWKTPYRTETEANFIPMLTALIDNSDEFRIRSFVYLQTLKKTWV